MKQQALAQRTQIARTLFEIVVTQRGKLFGKLFDDRFDRPFRHRAIIDFDKQFASQASIGEQVRIEIEYRSSLFLRACGKPLTVAAKLICRLFQRAGQTLTLGAGSSVEA